MSFVLLRVMLTLAFVGLTVLMTFVAVPAPFFLPAAQAPLGSQVVWQDFGWTVGFYPMSLQFLSVLAAGFLLGPGLGALSQLCYLALGFSGWPIFYNGGGPLYWQHPAVGYVLAFLPAVLVTGWLTRDRRSSRHFLLVGLLGLAIVHLCGLATLASHTSFTLWPSLLAYLFLPLFGQFAGVTLLALVCSRIPQAESRRSPAPLVKEEQHVEPQG